MKKIKIVFVEYQLICGGAEQALFDLVNLLDRERFEASVFVQSPGGSWEKKFQDAGIPVIHDYDCRKPTFNPVRKLGNFVKKCRVARANRQGGRGLLEVCLPEQPDIVVSYSAWMQDEIAFVKNAKSVKYIHGDPGTNPVYRKEAVEEQEILRRYDRIVCVSQAAWDSFRKLSGLEHQTELHYNPLNSDNVRSLSRQPVSLPEDVPLVCAVGRLAEEKGFERLLVIHKNLLDAGIRHRLVIVGDGPDRDFLPRLARALGVQDSVIFAGYQSNPYPYMARSRFLVNSSFTEGLPVIAMEALCLGIPVVSTMPSVGEAFGGEECGMITENSVPALEAGVRKMLTDEAYYAKLKAGAEKRSAFFDGKRMVREVEEMFLSLLETT
ncbi:MAG: glycosyltransferase [Clostridiales bacterium]|nr:glycosyltransferase [Clostridiales bacterium]